ncbi:MAG TPA: secretin N-terminal domain-containing protein [Verrucomicrobiae bacterium]|nr:secretin N-terminal domain-containing protein [Verrucomicrobiae bacterium]
MKNLFFVLLLAAFGQWAHAQVPPPPTGTNAPAAGLTNRPTRAIPALPGRTVPGVVTPSANGVPATTPTTPTTTADGLPIPGAQTPANVSGTVAGMEMTPHVSNAETIPNPDEILPAGSIKFTAAPLESVLSLYGDFVGRNVLRPATLPDAKIVLMQTTPLTRLEVVRALEAAMALNNVSVVNVGEKFVTVVPTADAWKIPGRINTNQVDRLPELGSVATHIAQLKYSKPSELQSVLVPFASGTAASPVTPIDSSGILVLRDNVANVKRMLEMIEKIDVAVPSEFVSEVIPIKYAKAEEIATALSSVGGGSGGTVGSRPTGGTTTPGASGFSRQQGGLGGYNQPGMNPLQGTTPTPTPSGGSAFSQNLQNIIRRAASSGDLQILGTTKIIADIRSNSLLVFATREDMKVIKDIIAKLDVVLAQVLIETIIMDVSLDNSWALGISAAQTPRQFSGDFSGAGGMNLKRFTDVAAGGGSTAGQTNAFTDLIGTGLRYFGKINDDIYVQVEAAASDGKINVIQKPRIQTSHATPASLFIGNTVPYVTSTYYGGSYGGGPSSSYQQLRVGIGLNVTPFINQDGLVVMKIDETIDEISGSTTIDGVGQVPNTTSRTLAAEVAVLDRESIMLGGFIRNAENRTKAGVPILKDIPLLGALFRSSGEAKQRNELMVLMRPTVLRTPELASLQVAVEKEGLPGVVAAEADYNREEAKASAREKERQRRLEMKELPEKPPEKPEQFNQVRPFTPEEVQDYTTPRNLPNPNP